MSEPVDLRCPHCRGAMKPVLLGELQDKHLECEYCGGVLDVADLSSVTHEEVEEHTRADGTRVRRVKRVTRTRTDPGADPSIEASFVGSIRAGATAEPQPCFDPSLSKRAVFQRLDGRTVRVDLRDPEQARELLGRELDWEITDEMFAGVLERVERHAAQVEARCADATGRGTASFDDASLDELLRAGAFEVGDRALADGARRAEPEAARLLAPAGLAPTPLHDPTPHETVHGWPVRARPAPTWHPPGWPASGDGPRPRIPLRGFGLGAAAALLTLGFLQTPLLAALLVGVGLLGWAVKRLGSHS